MKIGAPGSSDLVISPDVDVHTLVSRVANDLAELVESEADSRPGQGYCDPDFMRMVRKLSALLRTQVYVDDANEASDTASSTRLEEAGSPAQLKQIRERRQLVDLFEIVEEMCEDDDLYGNWSDIQRRFGDFVTAYVRIEQKACAANASFVR